MSEGPLVESDTSRPTLAWDDGGEPRETENAGTTTRESSPAVEPPQRVEESPAVPESTVRRSTRARQPPQRYEEEIFWLVIICFMLCNHLFFWLCVCTKRGRSCDVLTSMYVLLYCACLCMTHLYVITGYKTCMHAIVSQSHINYCCTPSSIKRLIIFRSMTQHILQGSRPP